MTDVKMKIEVEAEEFAEELSDEALDREAARFYSSPSFCHHTCAGAR